MPAVAMAGPLSAPAPATVTPFVSAHTDGYYGSCLLGNRCLSFYSSRHRAFWRLQLDEDKVSVDRRTHLTCVLVLACGLTRVVRAGAAQHWAFEPPHRPDLPTSI